MAQRSDLTIPMLSQIDLNLGFPPSSNGLHQSQVSDLPILSNAIPKMPRQTISAGAAKLEDSLRAAINRKPFACRKLVQPLDRKCRRVREMIQLRRCVNEDIPWHERHLMRM